MIKFFLSVLLIFQISEIIRAQDIIGKWKTISNIIEHTDGSSSDLRLTQLKLMPCMADIETVFESNGRQYTRSEKKCGMVDYNKLGNGDWKMKGNTISITSHDAIPNPLGNTATYTVVVINNIATLTHVYSAAEKIALRNAKLKKITIVYKRI